MHIEIYCLLNREQNQADRARRHVVNWALEFTAFYPGKKRKQPEGGPSERSDCKNGVTGARRQDWARVRVK